MFGNEKKNAHMKHNENTSTNRLGSKYLDEIQFQSNFWRAIYAYQALLLEHKLKYT